MGTSRLELYTGYGKIVEPSERERFRELVKRRARREPVAYLVGEKEFFSLAFRVTPDVLVPRPETEHVVEAALESLGEGRGGEGRGGEADGAEADGEVAPRVLDLGTGSGNIAVSVAARVPAARVDAVDLSGAALEVARENAERHGVSDRVRFLQGDLFEPLGPGAHAYRLILSNPPYVAEWEFEKLMPDVRLHEPRVALLDERGPARDGLGHYRSIAAEAPAHLEPEGWVIVEVGEGQAEPVRSLFEAAGLETPPPRRDHAGIERVVEGRASRR